MRVASRLLTVVSVLAATLLAGLGAPPVAAAQTPDISCHVAVRDSEPVVWVDTDATQGKIAIQRRAFDRYWWRGVLPVNESNRRFTDTPLPRTAARVEYRAIIRDGGKIIATADCRLDAYAGCAVVSQNDELLILTDFEPDVADNRTLDVVNRRSVNNGPSWWRGVAKSRDNFGAVLGSGFGFTDSAPNGPADYQTFGRVDGVIHTAYDCNGVTTDAQCTDIDVNDLVNPRWSTQPDHQSATLDNGVVVRILASADNVNGLDTLIVERPSLPALDCGTEFNWVVSGGGDRAYFSMGFGPDLGVLSTDGAPSFELVARDVSPIPAVTDGAVFYVDGSDLVRIDRASSSTDAVVSDSELRPYFTGNMGIHPNGNVYYVMESIDGSSRYLMEWNDSTSQSRVVSELPTQFDAPSYIQVSRDGTMIQLLDEAGGEYGSVPIN